MRRHFTPTFLGFILLGCLVVSGCATGPEITKISSATSFESYSGGYLDKVMVVGKPRDDANRIRFENYLTSLLEKRKVDTISSSTLIPDSANLNHENIRREASKAGVKAVLVSRVVGIDQKDVIFKQSTDYRYTTTARGTYMTAYTFGPHVERLTKVRLESGLFEVKTEKLIWGATSAIMNPQTADEAIEDFSKAIIQQLKKDGYIR